MSPKLTMKCRPFRSGPNTLIDNNAFTPSHNYTENWQSSASEHKIRIITTLGFQRTSTYLSVLFDTLIGIL